MTDLSRRTTMGLGLAAGAASITPRRARAQAPAEVKIAMLVPLSGPWARQGILGRWVPAWRWTTSTMPAASSRWAAPS